VANVSAAEIVTLDGNKNAVIHFLGKSETKPLNLANITPANTYDWSLNNSLLSLGHHTTILKSNTLSVGNLIATSIKGTLKDYPVAPGAEVALDNFITRSFQKSLSATPGHTTEICTLQSSSGAYNMKLSIVQSEAGSSVAKTYQFPVRARPQWDGQFTIRSSPTNNMFYGVTYGVVTSTGKGMFVAVSSNGNPNQVMTSANGINSWTSRSSPTASWTSVTYGVRTSSGVGVFVAVAQTSIGDRLGKSIMISTDGISWSERSSFVIPGQVPRDPLWTSVTYGLVAGEGRFVAVSTSEWVMTSADGITWTPRQGFSGYSWSSVTYGNGLFVAVAVAGSGSRVMTSPDGITWTLRGTPANNEWRAVTYGNGLFVAVSSSGTGNRVMTSPNGVNWTSRVSAADNQWYNVTYGNGLFISGARSGSGNRVMTSSDGITWTIRASAANSNWEAVAFGAELFVFVSSWGSGGRIMTSVAPSFDMTTDDFLRSPWHRLLPITSTSAQDIGVDINVNASTTTLRLVRLSGSVTSKIECVLTVYQPQSVSPVTISNATLTTTSAVVADPILYESTRITQVEGRLGIGTSDPTSTLTVAGTTSATSFFTTNEIVGDNLGIQTQGSGLGNGTPLKKGAYMSWNHDGTGRTEFVSKRGSGPGGFNFIISNGSGTDLSNGKQLVATLRSTGMSCSRFSAPGAIVGSLFGTGMDATLAQGVTISPTLFTRATIGTAATKIATFSYSPKSTSSRLFVHFDIEFVTSGAATDRIQSFVEIDGVMLNVKMQDFGQLGPGGTGTGTRSGTIFPLSAIAANTTTSPRSISIWVYMDDFDDTIALNATSWQFEVLERQT